MTGAALRCLYFTVVNSEGTKSMMINTALNELPLQIKASRDPEKFLIAARGPEPFPLCPPLGSSTIRFFFACIGNSCQAAMKSQPRKGT